MTQLDLFGSDPKLDFSADEALASQLPTGLHFGTSSWTFPGWSGIVYPPKTTLSELRKRGLKLYSRCPLLTSVGIDSSYHRPLDESMLRSYRDQLPSGFRCVSKVFSEITSRFHPRSLEPMPHFLDAAAFERQVLVPIASSFADHQGPLVLEFPELPHAPPIEPTEFAKRLRRFFSQVSTSFTYAVELRDRSLFGDAYAEVLAQFGVSHVLNYWERMPSLKEQFERLRGEVGTPGVVRLLIPPGLRYSDRKRKLDPFDAIVDPRKDMREHVLQIINAFAERNAPLFVIVNNKAEGCSPLTIRELAKLVVRGQDPSTRS